MAKIYTISRRFFEYVEQIFLEEKTVKTSPFRGLFCAFPARIYQILQFHHGRIRNPTRALISNAELMSFVFCSLPWNETIYFF